MRIPYWRYFFLREFCLFLVTTVSLFGSSSPPWHLVQRKELAQIVHTDLLRRPESQMDASLNAHCDSGSMDTYSLTSKYESVLLCLAKLISPFEDLLKKACKLEPASSQKSPSRSLEPQVVARQAARPPCQNQDEISGVRTIEPSGILVSFSFETSTSEQAEVQALIFEEKDFSLFVVDQPLQDQSLLEMMQKTSCVAGINGGYFQPDGTPLGLLVHYGKMIHPQQRGSILSGFFVSSPEKMTILRVGEEIPASAREVLQAGPFLLDHERPIIGLESTKKAYRSFLATSDQGMWVMGIISPVTLDEASHILDALSGVLSEEKKEKKLTRALNLDGGSSSSLWAKTTLVPFSFRSDVCVRNYLGIKEKKLSQ